MKKNISILLASLCLAITLVGGTAVASATTAEPNLKINAKSAVLMDYDTGTIVFTQNDKEHLPIASMVKIMTLLLTFERIDEGTLGLTDMVTASENAASMGGSQAFLDANSQYSVNELIKSIVVGSANDSCVALAEHISGSVDSFVAKMNERAANLGMKDTVFCNCTGLPGAEQYCCAHDVALMTRELISHKKFFDYSGVWMFDFEHPSGRVTQLSNTNKLIRGYEGCDGGKTGFTNEAKYCLSATAKRGNTRLISVVCGAETSKIRNAQNAALFNYGFSNYETYKVIESGSVLDEKIPVSGGKQSHVSATAAHDKFIFTKKGERPELTQEIQSLSLQAPVKQGDVVGTIKIKNGDNVICESPLISCDAVNKLTYSDILDEVIANW